MLNNLRKYFHTIAETIEVLMSLAVFAAVIMAIFALIPSFYESIFESGSGSFMHLLEQILSIVVGLEFISMLCKPDAENVTEVLIFLIARHVMVLETSALENLLSVISIAILFFIRYFVIQTGSGQGPAKRFHWKRKAARQDGSAEERTSSAAEET